LTKKPNFDNYTWALFGTTEKTQNYSLFGSQAVPERGSFALRPCIAAGLPFSEINHIFAASFSLK
jgi:hypothetical protein